MVLWSTNFHGVQHVTMRQYIIEFSCEYIVPDLNNFLATLDGRYEKEVSKSGGTVARKVEYLLALPFL